MSGVFKKISTVNNKEYRNSLHYRHRQRLKECFRKFGFDGFLPHNIIELLLFYVILVPFTRIRTAVKVRNA